MPKSSRYTFVLLTLLFSLLLPVAALAGKKKTKIEDNIHGGLVLQIGAEKIKTISDLAKTGRYLVRILEDDKKKIESARQQLKNQGLYGLVSVDQLDKKGKLPFTENLVNIILVDTKKTNVSIKEMTRVLAPGGLIISSAPFTKKKLPKGMVSKRDGKIVITRKQYPKEMDSWSHPRHASDGNAVSSDVQVGPPRRVRWVVGAQAEVRGMVTAGGKNFYAGVLTRDSFNGLRLWDVDLNKPTAKGLHIMRNVSRNTPSPVSSGQYLFAVTQNKLLSFDAKTGAVLHHFKTATPARHLLYNAGTLVAVCDHSVEAFNTKSGKKRWAIKASSPRFAVMGQSTVAYIQGNPKRGEKVSAVVIEKKTGTKRWEKNSYKWLSEVDRIVYHKNLLAYEVSTFNNDSLGNAIHILSATNGKLKLDHEFFPGMNHTRQARAMFIDDKLWVLHGAKDKNKKWLPTKFSSVDLTTGKLLTTYKTGKTHCFPPVATSKYLFAGEFDLTNLKTGAVDANRITKANCSRDSGWIPANGLIYLTPKHCTCWPMLRGYTALAPERAKGDIGKLNVKKMKFPLDKGAEPPKNTSFAKDDWPSYRSDEWRSASTSAAGPTELKQKWSLDLGLSTKIKGPVLDDWKENLFIKGPISAPVIANGLVYVALSERHEVVAVDAKTGKIRWRFTANGRVDTAPTIYNGLCLFGSKAGYVYSLNAKTGKLVWKMRAAPVDEQIVAYGQIESPWPVAGSVLISNDTAYFAAGRQSLADGGILIFAVDPAFGYVRWVERLDTIPQKSFYSNSGLEFDNYDLLSREGNGIAMSRWVFNGKTGKMSIKPWAAFAQLKNGEKSAIVPRGSWSYAPRHQKRIKSYTPKRALTAFRSNTLMGCLQGRKSIYRRDFDLEGGEKFDKKWITGWAAKRATRAGQMPWRSTRLAKKAKWMVDIFGPKEKQTIDALVYAGNKLYLAGSQGDLKIVSAKNGNVLKEGKFPAPMWDGIAIANGKIFYSTANGKLICIGNE